MESTVEWWRVQYSGGEYSIVVESIVQWWRVQYSGGEYSKVTIHVLKARGPGLHYRGETVYQECRVSSVDCMQCSHNCFLLYYYAADYVILFVMKMFVKKKVL